jgi:hypothetical protein
MKLLRPLVLAAVILPAGCGEHETGPSLSFVVESENLVSTAAGGNAALCCCRVRGTVRNTSSIPVHVNLNFEGRTAAGTSLGTALDFVANLQPGASAPYDAAGIFGACSQVASVRRTHVVTGVFVLPPS